MGNGRLLILIWGGAILLYIGVSKSSGSTALLGGLTNLVTKSTTTLQGR